MTDFKAKKTVEGSLQLRTHRIRRILFSLGFILSSVPFLLAQPAMIEVSGCDPSDIDGIYELSTDDYDGCPCYESAGKDAIFYFNDNLTTPRGWFKLNGEQSCADLPALSGPPDPIIGEHLFVDLDCTEEGILTSTGTGCTSVEEVVSSPASYDVALQKDNPSGSYHIGDPVTFTFTVFNNSTDPITNVVIEDFFPSTL
ncbi:MAG: DUF11 domain-containing protein, partial [Saprospiraceae bacterium]|nr:DUF11 domain-containing protein [Saprospiraceae bacterium]